ncbi:hypothetical protein D1AOALGA4SA_4028 [Olavius algarvensis Delta 1 endosymbiont]|nr:hypothetical protein D1AOALGA4SA_4028 [Olavius algarvensis Delta 1 endosymbiont]
MTNVECRMMDSLQASSHGTAGLRPDASLSLFKQAEYIIRRSMFEVHWFLFCDQTGRSRPAATACMKLNCY